MLSHSFMEYCLWGWDNLPRIVLMYYANFLSSPEGYFHTVICNAKEFRNTTANHDLHFISWDNPPKQHPHFLTMDDYQRMVDSNAPFARKFAKNEPVLDKIDSEILFRKGDGFVPGGWFSNGENASVLQNVIMNTIVLKPGPGARRFKQLITGLVSAPDFHATHCIWSTGWSWHPLKIIMEKDTAALLSCDTWILCEVNSRRLLMEQIANATGRKRGNELLPVWSIYMYTLIIFVVE